ncbi:MAG TPA: penicillin-binding transpeptidase domain-containing protein, partial [Phycisphaerae bacterium]|nr:penicillin-binding transpeptidase domain-containing protein [Phycisphaerae bacterium]
LPALADFASTHPGKTRTTLDAHIQQTAAQILSDHWQNLTAQNVDSAAIIIIDVPTGKILASLSRSTVAPSVDLTTAPRSTGSILKPFIYAAAFDAGIVSPSTQLLDSPKAWAGYVPSNFDREFAGPIAAADALAESRNIPAMILLAKVGIDRTIGLLNQLGIASPARSGRRYGLSLAIGGAEATPREVAEAYATLARGGGHVRAHMGAGAPPLRVIIPAQACWQTLAALSRQGRTEGVDPAAAAQHVAWKTGTSNGLRDAWCAAATRQCVVVVWLGNAQGRGAPALIGQEAAAPLALKIITQVDSTPCPPWPSAENKEITATPLVGNTKLSIVSPVSGTEILTDGTGPAAIILQCAGGEGTERWWFANGELVGMGNQENMEWQPAPGTYELRVIDRAGNGASLRVNVR